MRNRVGGVPALWDFHRFESVDPVVLATKKENYPALVQSVLRVDAGLSPAENLGLGLLSHEVLPSKRLHEFVLLNLLLEHGSVELKTFAGALMQAGLPSTPEAMSSAVDTFTLEQHAEADRNRYGAPIARQIDSDAVEWTTDFGDSLSTNAGLVHAVRDILRTGRHIASGLLQPIRPIPGRAPVFAQRGLPAPQLATQVDLHPVRLQGRHLDRRVSDLRHVA